jgi:hypothetical protein
MNSIFPRLPIPCVCSTGNASTSLPIHREHGSHKIEIRAAEDTIRSLSYYSYPYLLRRPPSDVVVPSPITEACLGEKDNKR